MIRPIDIRLNAAHPELPLAEAVTYTGAPSTMLIRGVPGNCGKWCITSVYVAATFPDGSTSTRLAVQSANGVWVATLPATATSGRTASGVRIMADGEDENGEIVTGYILGVADFAVASLGVTPAPEPGATSWQMLYFDAVPGVLRKGDVTKIEGVLKIYNGTAWEPFADLSGYVPTSRTINGKALTGNVSLSGADIPVDATPGAQKIDAALAGKASTADATLTERGFTEWVCNPSTVLFNGTPYPAVVYRFAPGPGSAYWAVGQRADGAPYATQPYDETATSLTFSLMDAFEPRTVVATRTALQGYQLGSQTDKPLASEAEAEALRQGKQDALTQQQLANIAAVPNKLDKSGGAMDIRYYHGPLTADNQIVFAISAQGAYIGFKSGGHTIYINSDRITIDDQSLALAAANPTNGNLAALDSQGNPTDSTIPAANVALKSELRYSLINPTVTTGTDDTDPQNPITYGAVTLVDRAANFIQFTSDIDELRITLPAGVDGKVRDFGLAVNVNSGVTPPAITILGNPAIYNPDGTMPELAEGMNLLYFSEIGPYGLMLVKGEQVQQITQ